MPSRTCSLDHAPSPPRRLPRLATSALLVTLGAATGVTLQAQAASEVQGEPGFASARPRSVAATSPGAHPGSPGTRGARASDSDGGVAGVEICPGPTITQSFAPETITPEAGITCQFGPLGPTAATSWARSFPIAGEGSIECVQFGVEANDGPSFLLSITLFVGDITGPYGQLLPLATTTVEVPAGTNNSLFVAEFPGGVPLVAGADLVVEIDAPTRNPDEGGDGGRFFPGMNTLGESAPSYIRSLTCGLGEYAPMSAIGFPQQALVMTLSLSPPPPPGCPYPPYCCELVCATEPLCCDAFWVSFCDELAEKFCGTLPICEPPALAELILLRSGQVGGVPGLPGQADSTITCTAPGGTGCSPLSLDVGSGLPFAAAVAGAAAEVIAAHPAWTVGLPSDPAARWINWNAEPLAGNQGRPAQSTLYAHPFTVSGSAILSAGITLTWAVDDHLGDPSGPAPIGAYVNGFPLPALTGGNYAGETTWSTSIPASALVPGTNYFYLYQRDAGCVVSGLIYSAHIEVCALPLDGPCVKPPQGMRGWWPFDETAGSFASDLTQYGNVGFHQPFIGGPTPVPGIVAGALDFDGVDDAVVVTPTSTLDVSCGAFSVDLWVKRDPPAPGAGLQTLVSHYDANGGWIFGIDPSTDLLQLTLEGSSLRCIHNSLGTVPVGVWTHVAVTAGACCGSGQRAITFYINGVASGTDTSACCDLTSLSGPASLAMGNHVWISHWFDGAMDEVEYFCRVLSASEIAGLYNAGPAGKCKQSCHASWDRQLCVNFGFSTPIDATIVNNSTVGRTFQWSITPSGSCPLAGVTYAPNSGTVFVGPGAQATVFSTATVPGPFSLGQGCFNVTFTDIVSGVTCTTMGTFYSEICGFIVIPDLEVVEVGLDETDTASFRVTAGPQGAVVPFQILAMPSDMVSTMSDLSLNGLPPGEPIFGDLVLAPNEVQVIDLDLWFNACGAIFDWTDVIFFAPPAPGALPIGLSSFGVRMGTAQSCEGDLNNDGVVDGADLGILLGDWGGSGPGDFTGDGIVDGADLGILLGAWGPCP